jgi:DNA-binding NtrC family response regulator
MENDTLNVLILDDEADFAEELQEFLQLRQFEVATAFTPEQGMTALRKKTFDLLILDIRLPGRDGIEILQQVRTLYPAMEVIMISGHGDMDTVIKAMRNGAIDYLRKPFRHVDIQLAIERTRKYLFLQKRMKQMEDRNSLISGELEKRIERNFIGESPQIKLVLDQASTAALYKSTNVLITGESGTGKEIVARIIHYAGAQRDKNFCAVNSSAVTDTLLESEFFGHIKGSFTGAISDKKGYFENANEGTLFLDEIADMPVALQAKLLRAIEEKRIKRVGSNEEISVDFRVISATNHDFNKLLDTRAFRLDLFHRLNTITIHIPPLRDRPEDISPLLSYFASYFAVKLNKPEPAIDPALVDMLSQYNFPGNVRELRNMTERALIFCKSGILGREDYPLNTRESHVIAVSASTGLSLDNQEQDIILRALKASNNNQLRAARLLGISRDALIRRMRKYNIRISKESES